MRGVMMSAESDDDRIKAAVVLIQLMQKFGDPTMQAEFKARAIKDTGYKALLPPGSVNIVESYEDAIDG
jgi:hypothetical protein